MDTSKRVCNYMFALTILLSISSQSANAQISNEWHRGQASISVGAATNLSVDAEISCHYMLLPYIGIGGGIGIIGQYDYNKVPFGEISSNDNTRAFWGLDKEQRNVVRPYLRPSLLFRTPTLIRFGRERDFKLKLQVEPGVQLTIPYARTRINYAWYPTQGGSYPNVNEDFADVPYQTEGYSSHKGNWCFWNLKNSITVTKDNVYFYLGYSISNFDIYSIRRNIVVEGVSFHKFYPETKYTHCVFAGIGFVF